MPNPRALVSPTPLQPRSSVSDKNLAAMLTPQQADSLKAWIQIYFDIHVKGSSYKTQEAKRRDMEKFMRFVQTEIGHDHVDAWTPAVTKAFQQHLLKTLCEKTGQPYKGSTINRVMATVRHFGAWLHAQRPFMAGNPLIGVRDVQTDAPDWNGVERRHVLRLKSACEQRIKACDRNDQNPVLEAAVFFMLLNTGLRRSEVAGLNVQQYHHSGLHEVMRYKSKRITRKIHLPLEAREFLEKYLASRPALSPTEPLFLSRYGNRLSTKDIWRICQRLVRQANVQVPEDDRFHLSPHKLRHTYLKKFADKHGVHAVQEASGNVSMREIFRYTKPSQTELDTAAENLYQ